MADDNTSIFGGPNVFGLLGGNWGGSSSSSGGLTPDQQRMLQQQGWYPRPDMVLPTGVQNTQPQGYSGLTPAQAATVNSIGYYTQPSAQQGGQQSMWQKAVNALGDPNTMGQLKGAIGGIAGPQKPSGPPMMPQSPLHMPYAGGGPYSIYRRASLDPKRALTNLQAGGIYG